MRFEGMRTEKHSYITYGDIDRVFPHRCQDKMFIHYQYHGILSLVQYSDIFVLKCIYVHIVFGCR